MCVEFDITDDLTGLEFSELFEVVYQITSDSAVAVPGQTPMSTVTIIDNDGMLKLNNKYIIKQDYKYKFS